jgi:hypothetical protein
LKQEHAMKGWRQGYVFRSYQVNNDGSNAKCPTSTLNYVFLAGHRGYGFCEDVAKDPKRYFSFTVLREPVSRVVSLFDMNVKLQHDATYTKLFGTKPLMELIKQYNKTKVVEPGEALLKYMATQQVRFMCGYECFLPKNKTMNEPSVMLARALKNIRKLDAVGITSAMNDLVDQLKLHFRWLPTGFKVWPHANTAKVVKSRLDDQSRAILESWSKEDIALYKITEQIAEEKTNEARRCLAEISKDTSATSKTIASQEEKDAEEDQQPLSPQTSSKGVKKKAERVVNEDDEEP